MLKSEINKVNANFPEKINGSGKSGKTDVKESEKG